MNTTTTTTAAEHMQLIEDCEHREQRLQDWERTYIDSFKHQLGQGRTLSKKQDELLTEIWERATAKG